MTGSVTCATPQNQRATCANKCCASKARKSNVGKVLIADVGFSRDCPNRTLSFAADFCSCSPLSGHPLPSKAWGCRTEHLGGRCRLLG